jgi:hypothetical protein
MLAYLDEADEDKEYDNDGGGYRASDGAGSLQKSKTIVYKAAKGDEVDEAMAKIINSHGVQLPIIRMYGGKYLIGTDSKIAIIKGTSCVVRVGGGFQNMEEYIMRHEADELLKIEKMMQDQGKTYTEVIKDLLNKYKAEASVVNMFMKTVQQESIRSALNSASPTKNGGDR